MSDSGEINYYLAQDNFNDFLQKLQQNEINSTQTEENKNVLSGKSLELKSKQSRTRVQ